jgi:hypothetical protein
VHNSRLNFNTKPKKLIRTQQKLKRLEAFVAHLGVPKFYAKMLREIAGARDVKDYEMIDKDLLESVQTKIRSGVVQGLTQLYDLRNLMLRQELLGNSSIVPKHFTIADLDVRKLLAAPLKVASYLEANPEQLEEIDNYQSCSQSTEEFKPASTQSARVMKSIIERLNSYMATTNMKHTWTEDEIEVVFEDGVLKHALVTCFHCGQKKTLSASSKTSVSSYNFINHFQKTHIDRKKKQQIRKLSMVNSQLVLSQSGNQNETVETFTSQTDDSVAGDDEFVSENNYCNDSLMETPLLEIFRY